MLELDRLRALHAVALHGTVHAAAGALHVTPSAVSQKLARLEEEVGQPLLERRGRSVVLTDAATRLVHHTQRALSALEEAEAELDAHRAIVSGRLTVAGFATAMRGLGPTVCAQLSVRHPQLRVVLRELEPHEAIPLVVRGDVDVALVSDWEGAPIAVPDGLSRAPLLDDTADIALPAVHRLAGRRAIALDELATDAWISWQPGTICHDWLLQTLQRRGHSALILHTAGEHATQLALVAAGLGAAVIPRLGRDAVPAGVCIVPVRPSLRRHVYALWRSETTRRTAVSVAIQSFTAVAAGLSASA